MKFRALMVELAAMRTFYCILLTLAKVSKSCVMRLTKQMVHLIATQTIGSTARGEASAWCQIEQSLFFSEYLLDGVTAEQPEIYLELDPSQLVKAVALLKSINTQSLKMKLSRRNQGQPCLSLEFCLLSSFSVGSLATSADSGPSCRQCVHDVPVSLLPRRCWPDYAEPVVPAPDLSIYLPDLKKLKHITERYKHLGNRVTLQGNASGQLAFIMECDRAKVRTTFRRLQMVAGCTQSDASISVDLRTLFVFLCADQISPTKVIANVTRDKLLHLFLIKDDVCFQFFVPATMD